MMSYCSNMQHIDRRIKCNDFKYCVSKPCMLCHILRKSLNSKFSIIIRQSTSHFFKKKFLCSYSYLNIFIVFIIKTQVRVKTKMEQNPSSTLHYTE